MTLPFAQGSQAIAGKDGSRVRIDGGAGGSWRVAAARRRDWPPRPRQLALKKCRTGPAGVGVALVRGASRARVSGLAHASRQHFRNPQPAHVTLRLRSELATGKPRAPHRRSARSRFARSRHDGARFAACARRESDRETRRARARRAVSRAHVADAQRGARSAPLRAAERTQARAVDTRGAQSSGSPRSGIVGALV